MLRKLQKYLRYALITFFASTILSVLVLKWCPVYVTPLMLIRCVQQVSRGEKIRMRHHWVPLDQGVSIYMPVAVIASEDQRYLSHHGFDFTELGHALRDHATGKRLRGGSTISQQVAKNVFLWPGRSWLRKGLEAYFTILIELIWGKHRIMEVYLNSIEMGDGIYGVDAVAWQHFGRSASQLTRPNCALIAATLPNPLRYSSLHPGPYVLRRQTQIMRQMRHIDLFPAR